MTTRLGRAKSRERSATFDAVGHRTQRAFLCGLALVPAAMVIAEAIDVRLAIGRAATRFEVARPTAGAMRIGKTFDALRAFANGLEHVARDQTTHVIGARVRRGITRPRTALRIIDAAYACGRRRCLSLAIRRISTARITPHTAAFVLRARLTHAAQTKPAISAIGILTAFSTRRPHRPRQTTAGLLRRPAAPRDRHRRPRPAGHPPGHRSSHGPPGSGHAARPAARGWCGRHW